MSSKEAVLELICEAKSANIDERRVCFLRKTIEKDLDRLEEYRKIEEEIGIDFITLSKILKQRFVYDNDQVKIELLGLHIKSDELYLYGFVEDTTHAVYLRLKDYGKTWALDKEEFYKNIK